MVPGHSYNQTEWLRSNRTEHPTQLRLVHNQDKFKTEVNVHVSCLPLCYGDPSTIYANGFVVLGYFPINSLRPSDVYMRQ